MSLWCIDHKTWATDCTHCETEPGEWRLVNTERDDKSTRVGEWGGD